jgi:hypothetical protein
MSLYHDKWRGFLSEGTKPQLTEEEQLLAEGRLEDVKKKYVELDKRGLIDDFSAKDPSGNNAYLGWMAKKVADFFRDQASYSARQDFIEKTKDGVKKFHLNKQRLKKKDLYQYKTVKDLFDDLEKLGDTGKEKRQKKKETAMEGSEIVYDNGDFFAVRPYTTDASCYYGRATRWCISSTQSQNYFDQYSADGKGFVMVRMEHLDDDNNEKKIALVYDRDGQLEEMFNAADDSIDEDLWDNAVGVNVLEGIFDGTKYSGKGQMMYNELWEVSQKEGFEEDKKVPGIWKAIVSKMSDSYEDLEEEPDLDDGDEVATWIYDSLLRIKGDIEQGGSANIEESPPGPDPAAFQAVQDEFDQNAKHAYVMYDEYDDGQYSYSGGITWEFDEIDEDEWVGEPDFSYNGDENDTVTDIARQVMDDNYIYPDEIEIEFSGVWDREKGAMGSNDALSIRVNFNQDYDEDNTPDGFETFANRVQGYDENYDAVKDEILNQLYKNNLLKSEALANAQQIQVELEKDLKHFDEIKIGDGEITAYGDLHVQLPRIPADFFELSRKMGTGDKPGEWYDRKAGLTGIARGMRESYIDFLKNKLLRLMDDSVTRQRFKSSIAKIFKKAEEDADKQLELPLQEADNPYELGNFTYATVPSQRVYHPESGKFTVPFYVEIPLRDDSLKWNMRFLQDLDKFWSLIEGAYEAAWTGMLEDFMAHNTTLVKRYLSMWDEKEAEKKENPEQETGGPVVRNARGERMTEGMNEHFQGWRSFLK